MDKVHLLELNVKSRYGHYYYYYYYLGYRLIGMSVHILDFKRVILEETIAHTKRRHMISINEDFKEVNY